MAQLCIHFRCVRKDTSKACSGQIEDCTVGAKDWLVQNLELSEVSTFVNHHIHVQAFQSHPQPTKVMRTTSIMERSLIEPISVTKCSKQVHESQHSHGLIDQTNLGKIVGGSTH